MSEAMPPVWLPDGWIMEVRVDEKNREYRYYICPESGNTFTSEEGVMCYLNGCPAAEELVKEFKDTDLQAPHQKVINLLKWLPSGWLIEIRVPNDAPKAGQCYKCYIDKSTGKTFCSKKDVLYFLSTGEDHKSLSDKTSGKSQTDYYVKMIIEYSPDGLPPGWIKEIRFRGNNQNRRQDCFYTDPVSGCVFRSMKRVLQYVEDGVLSKYAFQPRISSVYDLLALEQEFPEDVKNVPMKIGELKPVPLPTLDCKSSQGQKKMIRKTWLAPQMPMRKKTWLGSSGSK